MLATEPVVRSNNQAPESEIAPGDWRVLVVDDEAGVRDSLAAYLRQRAFPVDTAADGIEARRLLQQGRYDLVLTDIAMPEISGLDLLGEIKATDPSVEVIMITAYMDISLAIGAMRKGAYDFFTKPFSYDKVLLTIDRVRETQRLARQARDYEIFRRQKAFEERATLETTLALARAVEERDRFNLGHGRRTARLADVIAERLHFTSARRTRLRHASLLHDVGKVGIDDGILNKPGRLTDDEFKTIQRHSEIGEHIVLASSLLWDVAAVIRHHHEHWDGSGYPDGLGAEKIPLESRILCLADVYDSVTSMRPYRDPMAPEDALEMISSQAGLHFDPTLVEIFQSGIRALLGLAEEGETAAA